MPDPTPMTLVAKMITESAPARAIRGQKTYITAVLLVAMGAYGLLFGEAPTYANPTPMNPTQAMELILQGLGLGGLRAGVAKV